MKRQIIAANKIEELYKKENKSEIGWQIFSIWFMINSFIDLNHATEKSDKIFYGALFSAWVIIISIREYLINDKKGKLNELKKYKFFIENEDIINYELDQIYKSENINNQYMEYLESA